MRRPRFRRAVPAGSCTAPVPKSADRYQSHGADKSGKMNFRFAGNEIRIMSIAPAPARRKSAKTRQPRLFVCLSSFVLPQLSIQIRKDFSVFFLSVCLCQLVREKHLQSIYFLPVSPEMPRPPPRPRPPRPQSLHRRLSKVDPLQSRPPLTGPEHVRVRFCVQRDEQGDQDDQLDQDPSTEKGERERD